ncbi:redoxin family protein [Paraflavitalea sp. CAU 1676]|uniref:redoxin family protein n=1 Tax=Paraflavitalea sp. CAU 1676 TaxID=3032598 RepID=UPI0023DB2E51|nr:redoxin family protein [Paraflavitalea sp. CAU 1676]
MAIVVALSCISMQAQDRVTIAPLQPERGTTVTITYDPAKAGATIPAGAKAVTLVFSYSNLYDVAYRVPMQQQGAVWTTSFKLARYATFATFYLQSGEAIDKPAADRHYELAVYDGQRTVRDGHLYKGYSLSAQMGKAPNLSERQAAQYKEELALYPDNYEAKLRLLTYEMNKANGADKEKVRQQALKVIADKFNSAPTVAGNMNKVTMGYLIIGENSRLDSIRKVVREKYPDTELGRELYTSYIAKEKDTAEQIQLFEKELKKEKAANAKSFIEMHERLFNIYAARKDGPKALLHARKIAVDDENPYRPLTLKEIAQTLLDNELALDTARAYAERTLALSNQFPVGVIRYFPETGYIYPYVDDSTRQAAYNKAAGNVQSMLGLIALKQNRLTDANGHMEAAMQKSTDKETLDNVGTLYRQTGNTAKLQQLESLREQQMLTKVKTQRISRPAPSLAAFVDLKGQPVPESTWKNKVVIIDFWATWCVPCMQEMPYIQKLYDKYKDNPNVQFMIVNSGARNTLADAQGWFGNKKYSFPVYYTNDPAVGDKFKFTVIPATYVIDPSGNIQFANIGFEGPDVEMKLRLQIDMLLKP